MLAGGVPSSANNCKYWWELRSEADWCVLQLEMKAITAGLCRMTTCLLPHSTPLMLQFSCTQNLTSVIRVVLADRPLLRSDLAQNICGCVYDCAVGCGDGNDMAARLRPSCSPITRARHVSGSNYMPCSIRPTMPIQLHHFLSLI